jgi:hypothetical protein
MRTCKAIILMISAVGLRLAGHCEDARMTLTDASRIEQATPAEPERVSPPEAVKSFRGFFGYLEYDFDPDKPVPGFGPLPQSTEDVARLSVK